MVPETPSALEHAKNASGKTARYIPRWIGVGLFLYASIFALSQAKSFLVPVVLAFLLSMVFAPIRRLLVRIGLPNGVASLLIVMSLLIGFVAIAAGVAVPATSWMDDAPQIERQVKDKIQTVSGVLDGLFEAQEALRALGQSDQPNIEQVETQGTSMTTSVAWIAPNVLAQFLFTFVLLLFLLASGDMFYEKLVHVMPTLRDKKQAVAVAYTIERKLSRYLLTITLINAGLGVAVGTAMALLGMPAPLVFGVGAFVFNFIPYLGALVGIVIAVVVALVSFSWIGWSLIVAAVYFGLTTLEGQIVTPYFVGRSLRLNTVVVFLAVSFWAWLWSAVGMIVALPLLVAAKTACENIDALHHLGDFLSERHAELAPPE